jgi:hypothetical protein
VIRRILLAAKKSITAGGQFLFVIEVNKVEINAKVNNPPNELMKALSVRVVFAVEHIVLFNQNRDQDHADLTYIRK